MNNFDLEKELNATNALRINRLRVARLVINNKSLFLPILHIVFSVDNKASIKAAWVLEFVCKEKLHWIIPHLNYFVNNNPLVYLEKAVRPITKICEMLAKAHNNNQLQLTSQQIDMLIETCFDRLIQNSKVAVKAYAMETLYLLGKNSNWVHEELLNTIQQNIANESAAYKARGKKIIKKLSK